MKHAAEMGSDVMIYKDWLMHSKVDSGGHTDSMVTA
jgi:hypothetical protein